MQKHDRRNVLPRCEKPPKSLMPELRSRNIRKNAGRYIKSENFFFTCDPSKKTFIKNFKKL